MTDAASLKHRFAEVYPEAPEPRLCRAPGRVNLIGEHTDYNGLPVLPMTLDKGITIAFAKREDSQVHLANVDAQFPAQSFINGPDVAPSPDGSWDNYCKAAVQGLNQFFSATDFPGMNLVVTGDIPMAAGLSSSSALVVACALAYLAALGKRLGDDIDRIELASLLAEAEHYVGTQGGGMDQAIILLGEAGKACKIDFFPLRTEAIPVFSDHLFVVCNSLVKAPKSGEARHRYNAGPLTCRLIRALVERQGQEEFCEELAIDRLGDLWYGMLCLTDGEVEELFDHTFPDDTTTLDDAAQRLGLTVADIRERWIGDLREPEGGFRLKARARHQRTEYRRVEQARDAMLANDPASFGQLMNASHTSCADDFRVSCPELDTLVDLARRSGAVGARLTGAGFGGCTVNLVPVDYIDRFCGALEEQYYADHPGAASGGHPILVAKPSAGAGYIDEE